MIICGEVQTKKMIIASLYTMLNIKSIIVFFILYIIVTVSVINFTNHINRLTDVPVHALEKVKLANSFKRLKL